MQETLATLERIGIENGNVKTFKLRAERITEDPTIVGQIKVEPYELSIPLLAMLPVASMQLQEMDVEMAIDVVETQKQPITSKAFAGMVPGSSLSGSLSMFSAVGQSSPTTMKVHMKITKEKPEGMARLGDLLADLLSARAVGKEKEKTIDEIPGLSPDIVKTLKERGITTIRDFLSVTEDKNARTALAKELKISLSRIDAFRKKAKQILESSES